MNPPFGMKAVHAGLGRLMLTSVVCERNHTSAVSEASTG
ncbi:MAG: hypothetical protein ACJASJ_000310 [Candidatus Azotimanducaceae bacterium]